jgi:hypothetical protein
VDLEDLFSPLSIRKLYFDVNLKPSWSKDSLVEKVFSVGHADHHNVIECFYSVNIGQELIHYLIADLGTYASMHASLLAYGINFVKYYDMQGAFVS